jgi:hypothetical protein
MFLVACIASLGAAIYGHIRDEHWTHQPGDQAWPGALTAIDNLIQLLSRI